MYYSVDFKRHACSGNAIQNHPPGSQTMGMSIAVLEDLEATRHQSLEDTIRVILLRNRLQLLVVLRPVAGEDLLETSGVAPILVSTIQAPQVRPNRK